jgi:hypothetical protein
VQQRVNQALAAVRTARAVSQHVAGRRPVTGGGASGVVVSLTTHGRRVRGVHRTIETIAAGVLRPDRLVLWLDPADHATPTDALRRLVDRGLEVHEAPAEWGPHKKYLPYCLAHAADGALLVTADDDVLYPRRWLQDLVDAHRADPTTVWAHRSRMMRLTADESVLAPYQAWSYSRSSGPSFARVPIGMGGVAYPAVLQARLAEGGASVPDLVRRTDDLWLHRHALRGGFPVGQVREVAADFPVQLGSQDSALFRTNLNGGNDHVVSRLYDPADLELLREHARG